MNKKQRMDKVKMVMKGKRTRHELLEIILKYDDRYEYGEQVSGMTYQDALEHVHALEKRYNKRLRW